MSRTSTATANWRTSPTGWSSACRRRETRSAFPGPISTGSRRSLADHRLGRPGRRQTSVGQLDRAQANSVAIGQGARTIETLAAQVGPVATPEILEARL